MNAHSCEDIVTVFKLGCTIWYDATTFLNELNQVCNELFIEESRIDKDRSNLMNLMFGEKVIVGNQKAYNFEEQRALYQN